MEPRSRRRRSSPFAWGEGVVTLDMVAQAAGVSTSTVSRILNGSATVSAAKQQAVQEAVRHLGFRPNPVARGLAGGRTMSIGVVTQTISNPFYGEALNGIEHELGGVGYIPLFVSGMWNEAGERQALDALMARRVDGVIVLAGCLGNEALLEYAQHQPMVVAGRAIGAARLFSLAFDNRAGARLAVQHLLEAGHRRIAHITGNLAQEDGSHRLAGYRQAMAAAGVAWDPGLVVEGNFTEASGQRAVQHLLDSRQDFSAIFAANDQMAIGAALALYRRGLRVPDDVSLVGFDDLAPAQFAIPPLTTVRQAVYQMGRQAAAAVLDLLNGRTPHANLPEPQLVLRESTRPLHA